MSQNTGGGATVAVVESSNTQSQIEHNNQFRPKGSTPQGVNQQTGQTETRPIVTTEQQSKADAIAQQKEEGTYQTPGGAENSAVKAIQSAKDNLGISYVSGGGGGEKSGGLSERDLYVADVLNEYSKGFISGPQKDYGNSKEQRLSDLLGQVGLSYNQQTKTITDPLMEKINAGDIGGGDATSGLVWNYHDVSSPLKAFTKTNPGVRATSQNVQAYQNDLSGLTNNPDKGVATKKSEALGSTLGQEATGYVKKDSSGNVIPEYSAEQVASLLSSRVTNKEYAGNTSFLAGNIGTENSTGPDKTGQAKSLIKPTDLSSTEPSDTNPFVISGGHVLPAGLVYVPSQEAIDKANMARQEVNNKIALGNGLINLSNKQKEIKSNNTIGAGLEFEFPPGTEPNPITLAGFKLTNPLLGTPFETVGEWLQNQAVSTQALILSLPERAQQISKFYKSKITGQSSGLTLFDTMYAPYTQENAGVVSKSTYQLPSLIPATVKTGIAASRGKLDISGFTSERGPLVAATALGLDIATFLLPFERINPIAATSFKAVTEEGKVSTIAREVSIGYGPISKTVLSTTGGKIHLGEVTPYLEESPLGQIKAGEGLEFTTQGKLGTKILTSPEGLSVLQGADKLLPEHAEAVSLARETANLLKLSSRVVPNSVRSKAEVIPSSPLTSVPSGVESGAIVENIIPTLPPIKGTLSETLQLEKDLIQQKSVPRTTSNSLNGLLSPSSEPVSEFNQLSIPQTPAEQAAYNQVFGINTMKAGESVKTDQEVIRNFTTGDIDVDFGHEILGVPRAVAKANKSVEILNKVAGEGREYFKTPSSKERVGTNVNVRTPENPKGETVINILTKHDVEKGYGEQYNKTPFDIKIKGIVKVPTPKGKTGKFVTIEQNAMNRLESFITLHGPESEKSLIQPPEYTTSTIRTTETGYRLGPHEYRFKDPSKLLTQNLEQISRNLKEVGYVKEGTRLEQIKNRYIELYPEIELSVKKEKPTIEVSGRQPSRLTSTINSISSSLKNTPFKSTITTKPESPSKENNQSISSKINSSKFKQSEPKGSTLNELSSSSSISKTSSVIKPSRGSSVATQTSTIRPSVSNLSPSISSTSIPQRPLSPSPLSPSKSPLSPIKPATESPLVFNSSSSTFKLLNNQNAQGIPIGRQFKQNNLVPMKTKPDERIILKKTTRYNYIGNSTESTLVGLYNRIETIYGKAKTAKLSHKDYLRTTKGFPKLVNTKTTGLITSKKTSIGKKESITKKLKL